MLTSAKSAGDSTTSRVMALDHLGAIAAQFCARGVAIRLEPETSSASLSSLPQIALAGDADAFAALAESQRQFSAELRAVKTDDGSSTVRPLVS